MLFRSVYAGSHNEFKRTLDLAKRYPDGQDLWAPGNYKINEEMTTLDINIHNKYKHQPMQIPLWKYLWVDPTTTKNSQLPTVKVMGLLASFHNV